MTCQVGDIVAVMEELAPPAHAEEWDNIGLQVGSLRRQVEAVLVSLDVTHEVMEEAKERGAGLLVCHHPPIFRPMRRLLSDDPLGSLLEEAVLSGVAVYAAHTNLDVSEEGVNVALAELLGLVDDHALLEIPSAAGLLRVGDLPRPMELKDLASLCSRRLENPAVRFTGDSHRTIGRVAVCAGSGAERADAALQAGAQVLVTGDVGYHRAMEAEAAGLAVIDAGHYHTERPVVPRLASLLADRAGKAGLDVEVHASTVRTCPWNYGGAV